MEQYSWHEIETWAKRGETERITDLGTVLAEQRRETYERLRMLDGDLGHVLRVLALTPGRRFVQQLLPLAVQAGQARMGHGCAPRLLASLIAEAQPLEDALYVLRDSGDRHEELRACLFHELLLRGTDPETLVPRHALRPDRTLHRLAWLPDRLADMERGAGFHSRSYQGRRKGFRYGLSAPVGVDRGARRAAAAGHVLREVSSLDAIAAIGWPPEAGGWGDHEARVFVADQPIPRDEVLAVLATLPMDCVAGLGDDDRFEGEPCSLDDVWQTLFATGSLGGIYHEGIYGAYGRLAAWRSIAELSGAGPAESAQEVERRARACAWYRFEADSEWFHNELDDYGIAALTPDGRRLAVLAATDTD
ncbi:DUF6183 family protein [Streptomyces sp. MUSC 14]|uniref:DUF6183 family protein n=1 Tax=Streptomyces sp. MUSC 14 TaxID=1354889 RepID=UPI0009A10628|nr:DUF6183 family protein [Streptomyces sp. MUSC 14]